MPATTDPASKLGAIAAALATAFATIDDVDVHDHEPIGQELVGPTIYIGAVTLNRSGLDESERQLGADDWSQSWTVTLQVPMHDARTGQDDARRLVGEMAWALDDDHTLDGEATEARLVSADIGYGPEATSGPRLVIAECAVEVLSLMPRN